jgi:hypothetical protein
VVVKYNAFSVLISRMILCQFSMSAEGLKERNLVILVLMNRKGVLPLCTCSIIQFPAWVS